MDGRAAGDIVHPVRVDAGGSFLSYELWPRALRKRDVSAPRAAPTFYALQYQGRELRFNLTTNPHLLAPGFVSETRRRGGLGRTHIRGRLPACHLLGEVQDPELEGGLAAISACDGLVSAHPPPSGGTWTLAGVVLQPEHPLASLTRPAVGPGGSPKPAFPALPSVEAAGAESPL